MIEVVNWSDISEGSSHDTSMLRRRMKDQSNTLPWIAPYSSAEGAEAWEQLMICNCSSASHEDDGAASLAGEFPIREGTPGAGA